MSSSESLLAGLNTARKAVFAFLVISMIGSILSVIVIPPAMYFPHSRLLVYLNIVWPILATAFGFLAALLLSAIIVLASIIDNHSSTVGVHIQRGDTTLLFLWLQVVFMGLAMLYWLTVWFVETRKLSFVRRRRDEDEIGHWKGIGKEVWRDVRGRRREPSMRADL